ncbi:MAG: penicillin-binding protein activator [Porticoccaceae bacterium]|nr:MAG: penicillin-binding protein activator [Porticoccaceae bacterium]
MTALAGCAEQPRRGAYPSGPVDGTARAEALLERAAQAPAQERPPLLVAAADALLAADRPRRAARVLAQLEGLSLDEATDLKRRVLAGELALRLGDGKLGAPLLADVPEPRLQALLAPDWRLRWHRARGELLARAGQTERAVFELARASLLARSEERRRLGARIWRLVSELPAERLARAARASQDPTARGWYELALLAQRHGADLADLAAAFADWRRAHPAHPAASDPPPTLRRIGEGPILAPTKIAVWLPLSGELAAAGRAIGEGLLAAYFQAAREQSDPPRLEFFDAADASPADLLARSAEQGAELVIGPLRREAVTALAAGGPPPLPVLALNYAEGVDNPPPDLFQFGLSVADEARQAARTALGLGHRGALLILPQGRLGATAEEAFRQTWSGGGGVVPAQVRYADGVREFAPLLEDPLLIGESRARARRLAALLGRELDFRPRHRGDVDLVFLVAHPQAGRLIVPALDYLWAGDLPVFATSQIYGGEGDDGDLEGVSFTAPPWALAASSSDEVHPPAELSPDLAGLFALGYDAYRLHQWLPLLPRLPEARVRGLTGRLSVDAEGRVRRELPWARFAAGGVRPAPELDAVVDSP